MTSYVPSQNNLTIPEPAPHREYKSRLFAMLFSDKENLLELYNAVSGKHYTDPDLLQINTLENAIYISMHNDVSFIIDSRVFLYEHQSTYSPNLPLRDLFYISDLYSAEIDKTKLYGETALSLPTPEFLIFYNGQKNIDDKKILKLSDLYAVKADNYALDLTVQLLNINAGHNQQLLKACKTLGDYSIYVARVRQYAAQMPIGEAVERAITECIQEDVLADFLTKIRAEAKKVCIYEYDEEAFKQMWLEEGQKIGEKLGQQLGHDAALLALIQKKLDKGLSISEIAELLEEPEEVIQALISKSESSGG